MGFWKEVSMDVARGMSVEKATALNAEERYGNKEKAIKARTIAEVELIIDRMPPQGSCCCIWHYVHSCCVLVYKYILWIPDSWTIGSGADQFNH